MSFELPTYTDRVAPVGEGGRCLRLRYLEIANHVLAADRLFSQLAIGLDDQRDGLTQVFPGLLNRCTLGVRSGQFLDKGDNAAVWHMNEDGGQIHNLLLAAGGDDLSATSAESMTSAIIASSRMARKIRQEFGLKLIGSFDGNIPS